VIELDLMTEEQHSALPEDEEVTAADRLITDSPSATGKRSQFLSPLSACLQLR
jgi:hypothetical protein